MTFSVIDEVIYSRRLKLNLKPHKAEPFCISALNLVEVPASKSNTTAFFKPSQYLVLLHIVPQGLVCILWPLESLEMSTEVKHELRFSSCPGLVCGLWVKVKTSVYIKKWSQTWQQQQKATCYRTCPLNITFLNFLLHLNEQENSPEDEGDQFNIWQVVSQTWTGAVHYKQVGNFWYEYCLHFGWEHLSFLLWAQHTLILTWRPTRLWPWIMPVCVWWGNACWTLLL